MNDNIRAALRQGLGLTDSTIENLTKVTGCAISSSLINSLKLVNSSVITAWLNENLHKCIGVATAKVTSVSYTGASTVSAVLSINFENNVSVNDTKRALGLI